MTLRADAPDVERQQDPPLSPPVAVETAADEVAFTSAARSVRSGRLGPSGALALQRAAGNAAVGRVLARKDAPESDDVRDPFDLTDEELAEIKAAAARHRAQRREDLLATLEERDGMSFLRRVRELPEWQRKTLEEDAEFWRRVRKHLRGEALWSIQRIIRYGRSAPHEVNALNVAVRSGEWLRTRDLLMAYPSLKDMPGLREMIPRKFNREHTADLLAVLAEKGTRAESGSRSYKEAHYEDGKMERFTGVRNFELVRLNNHVRVIVRITLRTDPDDGFGAITDKAVSRWERGIKQRWNNKFRLRCGAKTLDIWFLPIFVYWDPNPHHTVTVKPGDKRSNQHKWHEEDSADTAAHEFGHMLGNPDEYNLPGKMSEIPASLGLSEAERKRSSYEGITGKQGDFGTEGIDMHNVMGAHHKDASVRSRHGWDVLDVFNAKLRKPGESEWTVELK